MKITQNTATDKVKKQPTNQHGMEPLPSFPIDNTTQQGGFTALPQENRMPENRVVDIMQNQKPKMNNYGVPRPSGGVMGPGRQQQQPLGVAALALNKTPFASVMRPQIKPGKPGSYPHASSGGFNMLRRG